MYKITKTIGDTKTINLVFDNKEQAQEVFNDLKYDEFIRFGNLDVGIINKETREERVNGELVYKDYRLSNPTISVTITLKYVEN